MNHTNIVNSSIPFFIFCIVSLYRSIDIYNIRITGLGKTVQLIALLAALQKKTGTTKDLKVIHQRQVYFERVSSTSVCSL